jgi:hypothetical protein
LACPAARAACEARFAASVVLVPPSALPRALVAPDAVVGAAGPALGLASLAAAPVRACSTPAISSAHAALAGRAASSSAAAATLNITNVFMDPSRSSTMAYPR